jgi:hypothetical protein
MKRLYSTFSEDASAVLDFARCQRADGSYYGTSGQCRKGKEVGDKEVAVLKSAAKAGNKKAKLALDVVEGKKTKAQAKAELSSPAPKAKAAKDPKEEYATLLKKQQELVQKGDITGAMKLNDKVKAAADKVKTSPEAKAQEAKLKKDAESRKKAEENFETAQKKREDGQLAANLTAKDKKVIGDYTRETGGQSPRSYDNMNGCLRFPPSCPDPKTSKQFVKEFDAALKKLPKNDDGNEFYRGIQVNPGQTEQLFKALENAKPGTRMKDPGYGSYSAERKEAERFTNRNRSNIIFITRSKSMTPINAYSMVKEENEAILPRGTEQTIRSVKREGKNLIVELD